MTVPVAGLILSLASTAYGVYSTTQTTNFNEAMAQQDADYSVQLGEVDAEEARRDYLRARGENKVTVANSGADLLSTSVIAAEEESAAESALEISNIRAGAQAGARGSLIGLAQERSKRQSGRISGAVTAGTTLLNFADK